MKCSLFVTFDLLLIGGPISIHGGIFRTQFDICQLNV